MRRNASKSEIHDYSRKSIQDARQRIARRLHEPMDEEASHPKDTRNLAKRLSDESHFIWLGPVPPNSLAS